LELDQSRNEEDNLVEDGDHSSTIHVLEKGDQENKEG